MASPLDVVERRWLLTFTPRAGAHWRTHATTTEPVQRDWDVQTFEAWEELLAREKNANGGREFESGSGLKV